MANLNRFINKDKYLKFCELHKLEEFYAVVGSSFAALSLVEGLRSKNIVVFEKGSDFNPLLLRGLRIKNNGTFSLKENSIEESVGGASNTWTGRLSEMNHQEFCGKNKEASKIFYDLSTKYYKKSWEFFGFKKFIQAEKNITDFKERVLPEQKKPLRAEKLLKKHNIQIFIESKITAVGEDKIGSFLLVEFSNAFQEKIYFKKIILANGGLHSSLLLKKSFEKGFLKSDKSKIISKNYMNHPKITFNNFFTSIPSFSPFVLRDKNDSNFYGYSLSDDLQKKYGLKNTYFTFHPVSKDENTKEFICAANIYFNKFNALKIFAKYLKDYGFNFFSILKIIFHIGCRVGLFKDKIKNYHLEYFCEMAPNVKNKIFIDRGSLNSEVNLSEKDYINLEILHQKLVSKLSDNVADQYKIINFRDKVYQDSSHHIGGIPMSENLDDSVIDKNLRVLDSKSIFLCSSSVFQYSGSSNPTLTIVALGLRLADHLKRIN